MKFAVNRSTIATTTIAFLAICISGCDGGDGAAKPLNREQLYRLHCSGCHGDGSGNGHIAGTLPVRPRNLKHTAWQAGVTDEHITSVIRLGGQPMKLSEGMPAFADKLSEEQIQQLTQYIRALGRR